MKFNFRLEKILRHRKMEQDIAQREYQEAQALVRTQLKQIEDLYAQSDAARLQSAALIQRGGSCGHELVQIEDFISGQAIRIQREREKVRKLMSAAEEKQDILIEKMKSMKVMEKLKEKKLDEFKTEMRKEENKKLDEIMILKGHNRGGL